MLITLHPPIPVRPGNDTSGRAGTDFAVENLVILQNGVNALTRRSAVAIMVWAVTDKTA